jgi:predicted Rossmann fold nucleotide-binding protein DprA/Smf involved in DNA uptake
MLSLDSWVLLVLCSRFGLPNDPALFPLTLREWNLLERRLKSASLQPSDLPEMILDDLETSLLLTEEEASRIVWLIHRLDEISTSLEWLAVKGIRVTTRLDEDYPLRYHQRLKDFAPVVLFYAGDLALLGQPGIAIVGSRKLDQAGQECAAFIW